MSLSSGAARVQADFTLEAALPQSKQISLLKRFCRSPSRLSLEAALPQSVRKASGFPITGSRESRLSLEAA